MEGIAAVALLIALLTYFEMNRRRKRLERQQAQWETLCREMGRTDLLEPAFPPEVLEQVRQYKAQGKTTEAIRCLRRAGDLDLAEAKAYLDKL